MATRKTSARKPAKHSPVNLKTIETELNRDAKAQAAFVKNPSKYLEARGLKLHARHKAELKSLAKELAQGPKLASGADTVAKGPIISIRIRRYIRGFAAARDKRKT